MGYFILFALEVFVLFFLSRAISKTLSRFLPISILSFLFFPGVIVHELSHLLVAAVMFVRVGEIEFSPKVIDGGLKLGSVEIAKTDPVRRAVIGFAPVFIGISIILGIVYFASTNLSFLRDSQLYVSIMVALGIFYILFVISNTMFSSGKDMEGTIELLAAFLVIFISLYLVGFRFPESFVKSLFSKEAIVLIQKSSLFLLAPIAIDALILGIVKILTDGRR